MWGEPYGATPIPSDASISTHSPRVGRTNVVYNFIYAASHFNSLAPCGANLIASIASVKALKFQLTRPVWGEPRAAAELAWQRSISTHSPRVGRTLGTAEKQVTIFDFNSLAPCGANQGDNRARNL